MFIYLYDYKYDRLGVNILNYIVQIIFAHKNNILIKYINDSKYNYKYYNSEFVIVLFNYIDKFNEELNKFKIYDDIEIKFKNPKDCILTQTITLRHIQEDLITYFFNNIYNFIKNDFNNITIKYNNIPFDIHKTILVHLRLDDVVNRKDYDGSICSEYYKNKIYNNEYCYFEEELYNKGYIQQAPLSTNKIINIINKAQEEFNDYKIILITSPISDTSFLNYDVIKNNNENYDLYLLTMCEVVILSKSCYALSSLFYKNKKKVYIPLFGFFTCLGLDTIYDKNNNFIYFY